MKSAIPATVIFLCSLLLLFLALPTERDAAIYDDTLRLHILANSDSESDQAEKIAVRDFLLSQYGKALSSSETITEATGDAAALLPEMEAALNGYLAASGSRHTARLSLGKERYDRREYETFSLPAGVYTSLRVQIGEAEGHNWWCVMYPPLCLGLATDAPEDDGIFGYSDEEVGLISGRYRVKFRVLEVFSDFLSGND